MARLITREFNPAVPVVVRRFFVAAGRHWNPGAAFDWRRLAVDQRRVKQLFDAGKLMHADGALPAAPAAPVDEWVQAAPVTSTQEMQDEDIAAAEVVDDLTNLNLKELREIAAELGAPIRVSRTEQRQSIREARAAQAQMDE